MRNLVKKELPHIKYVIDTLYAQGLSPGALPEIYGNLKNKLNTEMNAGGQPLDSKDKPDKKAKK